MSAGEMLRAGPVRTLSLVLPAETISFYTTRGSCVHETQLSSPGQKREGPYAVTRLQAGHQWDPRAAVLLGN